MAQSISYRLGKTFGRELDGELVYLVHASRAGDRRALDQLIRTSSSIIRNVARRIIHDPDELSDVVQHVCIKITTALGSYDESRRFSTWLYRVTINCAIDHLRQIRRHAHLALENASLVESPSEQNPEHLAICHERAHLLRTAAAHLPVHQERLILRHELDGLSVSELSREMGQPISAVRWHLLEARRKLRREFRRVYRPAVLRSLLD